MPNYNLHSIKTRRSYNLTEIAKLFGINRQTCRRWIKYEGLMPIEKGANPLLVMGEVLKEFLRERIKRKKSELEENEFFCFKCRRPVKAKIGSEKVVKTGKRIGKNDSEQLIKTGVCEVCKTPINRFLGVCQQD